jgi:DNA helicase-2/ATP-dependent DNA helicase PcrA
VASLAPAPDRPEALLADLNPAQREAVITTSGPVLIQAAAGTGKTRVISRRTAYAVATGVVPADQVLVVTFTEKAAGEMVERLAALGLPGVTARTFHAHSLSQLRHFWPSRHDGRPLPETLASKAQLLGPMARRLPGHYRFTPVKDLADEIEWAKSRRVTVAGYPAAAGAADRRTPIPLDLMARVYAEYERAKDRSGRLDFDDMLTLTVDLLEGDPDAAAIVRARKRWFSVDEYQDTNPLQERLLELWAGDSDDICVVGDEDQTIYTFAGASPALLTGFASRHPGTTVVTLAENYRSTPQVLELANRLLAADGRPKRLIATHPSGPVPTIIRHATAAAELEALAARAAALIATGTPAAEIAVLVRTNAQLAPLEEALTRRGLAFRIRGVRFFDRPEVRAATDLVRKASLPTGADLAADVRALFESELGLADDLADTGDEARERAAALETLLAILAERLREEPATDAAAYLAELRRRAAHEREGAVDGINLLTYHRAKGLEWDAVFLPMLEEGSLPIRGTADDDTIAEERRLLYVGITRARTHLALSWAERRDVRGGEVRRRRSRFLEGLGPPPPRRVVQLPDAVPPPDRVGEGTDGLFEALRGWRAERARLDGKPAYIVAHDSTLSAIAEARPATLAALRRVPGIGPAKLEQYGQEIVAVVAAAD